MERIELSSPVWKTGIIAVIPHPPDRGDYTRKAICDILDKEIKEINMPDANDYGPEPYVVDIENLVEENEQFRVAKWTGKFMQMTVMCIQPGDDIGLEMHDDRDQFLCIEEGCGKAVMGSSKDNLPHEWEISDDWAVIVPAGIWHNIVNTGDTPLKLYSIYSPAEHPKNTIHKDKAEADAAETSKHTEKPE